MGCKYLIAIEQTDGSCLL